MSTKGDIKRQITEISSQKILNRMRAFRYSSKIKKAALMYIATRCGDEELTYLRDMFLKLDDNKNGYVESSELL
jgi:hypothetical protein